ncbi:MAG: FkbM family methyltransferase [Bacteroidota bacterium]
MSNNYLLQRLHQIEQLARAGRWERFSYQPLTYASTLLWRNLIYRFQQRAKLRKTSTFFGTEMKVLLPAGMDIFLLDAKTHDSEIRLSRWLIQNLSVGDTFVDVGAHFGFFSLLASYLVQSSGQVIAFEAAISTFKILQDNVRNHSNIIAHHLAVSDQLGKLIFYEFPVLYSEYNTLKPEQFKDRKWVRSAKQIEVKSITLDQFLDTHKYFPNCIKIDVEGAEEKVLRGFESYLRVHQIKILVEATLLNIARQHSIQHYLESLGYSLFIIQSDGKLRSIQSIEDHLYIKNITSDNFVFQKV